MKKRLCLFMIILLAVVLNAQSQTVTRVENSKTDALKNYASDTTNKNRLGQHSEAFVTVTFDGLIVLCLNDKRQAEVGVLKNEHHKLSMEIREVSPNGVSTTEYPINGVQDLWIGSTNPATRGVTAYTNPRAPFNRKKGLGDREDFRWILDMEGSELHNKKLSIASPENLTPTLHFTHGVFYTSKLFEENVSRVEHKSNKQPTTLGKVAEKISVDIYLDDNASGVVLSPEGNAAPLLMLNRKPGTRYEITVKNMPHTSTQNASMQISERSHFSFYYEAINDRSGKKFDLKVIEKNKNKHSAKSLGNSFLAGSYFPSASLNLASPFDPPCTGVRMGKNVSVKGKPDEKGSKDGIEKVRILLQVLRALSWR
jgi:hypothetical protein